MEMGLLNFFKKAQKDDALEEFEGVGTILLAQATRMAEAATESDVLGLASSLSSLVEAQKHSVKRNGGRITQYVAGSIIGYWISNNHADQAMACASEMTCLELPIGCRVVLGTGEVIGKFVGPKKKYRLLGTAMTDAEQLEQFSCSLKNVILFSQGTKDAMTLPPLGYSSVGSLPILNEVFACAR